MNGFYQNKISAKKTSMLKDKIRELAAKYSDEFIEVRHYLHARPELSFKEFETSKYIQQKLITRIRSKKDLKWKPVQNSAM